MDIVSPSNGVFHRQVFCQEEKVPLHFHPEPYISYVQKGAYLEKTRARETFYKERTIVFHPARESHSNHVKARTTVLSIFDGGNDQCPLKGKVAILEPVVFLSPTVDALFYKMAQELQDPDPYTGLILDGLSLEIFGEVFRTIARKKNPFRDSKVSRVIDILHDHMEEALTHDQIAKAAGLEKSTMVRGFKGLTGLTIGEYIRKIRVEKAKLLLEKTSTPLCEVALEAGFYDQSHFVKVFRKETRTTPLSYRKNFQSR